MELGTANIIEMAIFAGLLVALAIWAQSFRTRPRDIIGHRNIFFAISAVLMVVCIGAIAVKGFNWGMDFTGGTVIEVGLYDNLDTINTTKVSEAVAKVGKELGLDLKDPQVQLEEKITTAPAVAPSPTASPAASPGLTPSPAATVSPEASPAATLSPEASPTLLTPSPAASPTPSPGPGGFHTPNVILAQLEPASPSPETTTAPSPAATTETASPAAPATTTPSPATTETASPAATATPSPGASPSPAAAVVRRHTGPYKRAIIRLGKGDYSPLNTDEITKLLLGVEKELGRVTIPPLSTDSISATVGKELFWSGLWAVVLALVLQLLYITLRFQNSIKFGVAADIALVHDVIIVMGLYSLFGRQVDSPLLAALFTVIGYSVMDSIVIFDRIRENSKLFRKGSFEEITNRSVNETMTRSINTLMTVLLCLFALFFFGSATLQNFAFSLLVGVTSGAYSSIFLAAPVVVVWDQMARKKEAERVSARRTQLATQPAASSTRSGEDYPSLDELPSAPKGSEERGRNRNAAGRRKRKPGR